METLEADVLVIGAGSAGMAAALTARHGGARILMIEKMATHGGTSRFAEGLFAAESALQIRKSIGITRDQAFRTHMDNTHWYANGRLVRAYVDKSADTIDWLQQLGVTFTEPAALFPDGPRTWHLMEGGGHALVDTLFEQVKAAGIEAYLGTPVTELVHDAEGDKYIAVGTRKKGEGVQVLAKAVIIAAGGFASNRKMMEEHTNVGAFADPVVDLDQQGELLELAWSLGAARSGEGVLMSIAAVPGESPVSQLWAAGAQPFLWVNLEGERFCDESVMYRFPYSGNALASQKDGVLFSVFDEDTKNFMIEQGICYGLGEFVPVGTKITDLPANIERGVAEGKAFIDDTTAGLAAKMGVDRKALEATIAQSNECFDRNADSLFAKDTRYLRPVRKPTFYAIKSTFHVFTTLGGIKIDHKTQVVDEGFGVIPGLYAVGNAAGGIYGESYEVITTGGSLGFAVNSGRIAGENAVEYLGL
ncbi:MAG: FAD-dependent oxidoreductase [Thermoleophilia bacterium]|nr:FAD-dependent oxidoreductase [Thermoleophilia bacterium]